jgi:hypothetical protein
MRRDQQWNISSRDVPSSEGDSVVSSVMIFSGERYPEDAIKCPCRYHISTTPKVLKEDEIPGHGFEDVIAVFIGICVTYSFASDPDGRHQTRVLYELNRSRPNKLGADLIRSRDMEIPASELYLSEFFVSGSSRHAD